MSDKYSCFCEGLSSYGYNIIATDNINVFHAPEQKHADMQILRINNDFFLLKECLHLKEKLHGLNYYICSNAVGKNYPENILLNFLFINDILYGKLSSIPQELDDYCEKNNIKRVNINQGYARCSSLVLNNSAVITADVTIEKALKKDGVEVLRISQGDILLEGFNYGFIGGASTVIDNNVIFFGNVEKHKNYSEIEKFILDRKMKIKILCKNMPFTDIGGAVQAEQL